MKKIRIFAFSLCLLLLSVPVKAAKETEKKDLYDDVCPVNVQYSVTPDEDEPLLHLTVFNATAYPISYLEFSLHFADDEKLHVPTIESSLFHAYAPNLNLEGFASHSMLFSAEAFPGAETVLDFRIEKIIFSDDTEWTAPETELFAKAYLYADNNVTADGRYILKNGALRLTDYSFSSYARTWYIWDDEEGGWISFSRDLIADCPISSSGAAIKLEINNNPLLYEIVTFEIAHAPASIGIQAYATEKTETLSPVKTGAMDDAVPEGTPSVRLEVPFVVGDYPCVIGLWDFSDSIARTWDIWDGTAWVTFSYDRGPICEIWRTGDIYLRLSYPGGAAVYAIEVQGK